MAHQLQIANSIISDEGRVIEGVVPGMNEILADG
jgi:hypothetical protein